MRVMSCGAVQALGAGSALVAMLAHEPQPARAQQRALRLELVREFVIDGNAPGSAALTSVNGLAVARDGSIFVLQPQEALLRRYDREGAFLGVAGRRGDGPEEFRFVSRAGWVGDSLWVIDDARRRIVYVAAAGHVIRAESDWVARFDSSTNSFLAALLSDGSALVVVHPTITARTPLRPGAKLSLMRETRAGVSERIVEFPLESSPLGTYDRPDRPEGRRRQAFSQPFVDRPLFGTSPQGDLVVTVERRAPSTSVGTFIIRRFGADGRSLNERSYEFASESVRQPYADSVLNALIEMETRVPPGTSEVPPRAAISQGISRALIVPRYFPPFDQLVVGADGTLWLRSMAHKDLWSLIASTGEIFGQIRLPASARLLYGSRDMVWFVEYDMNDVPMLVRGSVKAASARGSRRPAGYE